MHAPYLIKWLYLVVSMTLSNRDEPLLTNTVRQSEFAVPDGSLYIFGSSSEQRAAISSSWHAEAVGRGVVFVEATEAEGRSAVDIDSTAGKHRIGLRSPDALFAALDVGAAGRIYLDITGLAHHIWASLLIAIMRAGADRHLTVIYVEPAEYTPSADPIRGALYDLSERIEGIAALPGLAFLRDSSDFAGECVIPMLGFEGARLAHVLEHTQPSGDSVFPIIGVPGFRIDYPFVTYDGNFEELDSRRLWHAVRFATANCPFSGYFALRAIAEQRPRHLLRIAPIGTKPHGLGAVLFALSRPSHTEIVYDHPVRKAGRTSGSARVCIYDVGSFIGSDAFRWTGDFALDDRAG